MFKHSVAFAAIAGASLLVACTTPDAQSAKIDGAAQFAGDARLGEETNRICFASGIDSFQSTTDDTVVVRQGQNHYLVEVFGTCTLLDHAGSLAFASNGSCVRRGDRLLVSDSVFGLRHGGSGGLSPERCTVRSIYDWTPDAEVETDAETEAGLTTEA